MTLSDVAKGEAAQVRGLPEDPDAASLCAAMGIAIGVRASVLRRAPFGGPLHVRVGEIDVAIGRELASCILVEP